jgi:hypothetical protein
MASESENPTTGATGPNDESPKAEWARRACDEAEGILREVDNAVLAFLPVEVVEHLQASRKHLAAAAIRIAEMQNEKADETVRRARDIHAKKTSTHPTGAPPTPPVSDGTVPAAD